MKLSMLIGFTSCAILSLAGAAIPSLSFSDPVSFSAPSSAARSVSAPSLPQERLATVRLDVDGMTCGGCALAVRLAVRKLEGVKKADVSYEEHKAIVTYDPAKVDVTRIIQAVRDAGFTAKLER